MSANSAAYIRELLHETVINYRVADCFDNNFT